MLNSIKAKHLSKVIWGDTLECLLDGGALSLYSLLLSVSFIIPHTPLTLTSDRKGLIRFFPARLVLVSVAQISSLPLQEKLERLSLLHHNHTQGNKNYLVLIPNAGWRNPIYSGIFCINFTQIQNNFNHLTHYEHLSGWTSKGYKYINENNVLILVCFS